MNQTNETIGTSAGATRTKFQHMNNPQKPLACSPFRPASQTDTYLYTTHFGKTQDQHQLKDITMTNMVEYAEDQYEARYDDTGGDIPSGDFHDDDYVEDTTPVPAIPDEAPIEVPIQLPESNSDEELGKVDLSLLSSLS
jgi:hypothetical protein